MKDDELLQQLGIPIKNAAVVVSDKKEYTHTRTEDLENGCPFRRSVPLGCWSCNYTDIIGYCCYPVNINAKIAAGQARPMIHDYSWAEREDEYEGKFFGRRERPIITRPYHAQESV